MLFYHQCSTYSITKNSSYVYFYFPILFNWCSCIILYKSFWRAVRTKFGCFLRPPLASLGVVLVVAVSDQQDDQEDASEQESHDHSVHNVHRGGRLQRRGTVEVSRVWKHKIILCKEYGRKGNQTFISAV